MYDFAEVTYLETLFLGRFADADPVDIALAHVPDSLSAVDHVMDLALEDGFKIRLHLASGHFHPDAEGQRRAGFNVVYVLSHYGDLAVFDFGDRKRGDVFEPRRPVAAEFNVSLFLADALALEGRAKCHRDGHLGDFDLAAANLQRLFHDAIDGHIRHNMFVRTNAGRQNLRNVGIGDGREAVVDRACRRSIFFFSALRRAP